MRNIQSFLADVIPEIDPERIVTRQYGPRGLVPLKVPTKACDLICEGCKGSRGYLNLKADAWCCFEESCWGPMPEEKPNEAAPQRQYFQSLADLGVPEIFQGCSLESSFQPLTRKQHFQDWVRNPKGFSLFSGGAGSGKTYFAYAILQAYLAAGKKNARFFNVPDFYHDYRNEVSEKGNAGNLIARFTEAELLLMDDLGQRTPTDAFLEFLYVIINKRFERNRATLITTNLSAEAMEKRLGEAITSRLLSGQNHFFDGKDRRLLKNKAEIIQLVL